MTQTDQDPTRGRLRAKGSIREARARRHADGDGRDGGDAPAQDARAADLRLRPVLVGRLRDGGGADRPGRHVARGAHLVFPISIAVSVLLAIVIASYRQTVRAYSTSGGSYVVSKENLGHDPEPRRRRPRSSPTTC